jgi:hypothetical protein
MAKSKKRGGQKAHNKRISSRNATVQARESAVQKLFNESIKAQIEEMKKKAESESGNTINKEI